MRVIGTNLGGKVSSLQNYVYLAYLPWALGPFYVDATHRTLEFYHS